MIVTIEDNGIGIASDLLPRVFELFTQAEQGIDRRQGGLGIGLSVAKRLIVAHGGDVVAESRGLGCGSRFTVRLPRIPGAAELEELAPPPRPAAGAASHRVLVVDDNSDGAEMLSFAFRELGHDVRIALDGHEALEVARGFSPGLVFLDLGLPGLSGYEVIERLRQIPGCARVPIVAVTGYARESDRARTLQAGFSAHMAKPIDITRLGSIVEEMIGAGAAASPGGAAIEAASRPGRATPCHGLEGLEGPGHVEALFAERLGIPLAPIDAEEVAPVDVDRSRQAGDGVGDRVDDIGAEHHGVLHGERARPRGFDAAALLGRETPPEDVVLPAGVDPDHRPHPMVVRHECHVRAPDDIEDGQVRGAMDRLDSRPPRFAEPRQNGAGLRDGPRDDLPHGSV